MGWRKLSLTMVFIVVAGLFVIATNSARAEVFTWVATDTGSGFNEQWTNSANWSSSNNSETPGVGDTALIINTPDSNGPKQQTPISVQKIMFGAGATADLDTEFADWSVSGQNVTFIEVEAGNSFNNNLENRRSSTPQIQIQSGDNTILNHGTGSLVLIGNPVAGRGGIRPINSSGSYNLIFDGSGDTTTNSSFDLSDNGTRVMSLTKNGTGTLTLNTINSFTGATTLHAGTLILDGSSTYASDATIEGGTFRHSSSSTYAGEVTVNGGSFIIDSGSTYNNEATVEDGGTIVVNGTVTGDKTINQGGTLSGTGEITGVVLTSATIAPGQSIGTLTVGNLFLSGTDPDPWQFELGPGHSSDRLDVLGDFVNFANGLVFDFLGSTDEGTFDLVTWGGDGPDVNDISYTNLGGGLTGSFQITGNTLQFVAIPEPASVLLLGMGLAGLAMRRSKRVANY